jgi:hypothetical protein
MTGSRATRKMRLQPLSDRSGTINADPSPDRLAVSHPALTPGNSGNRARSVGARIPRSQFARFALNPNHLTKLHPTQGAQYRAKMHNFPSPKSISLDSGRRLSEETQSTKLKDDKNEPTNSNKTKHRRKNEPDNPAPAVSPLPETCRPGTEAALNGRRPELNSREPRRVHDARPARRTRRSKIRAELPEYKKVKFPGEPTRFMNRKDRP